MSNELKKSGIILLRDVEDLDVITVLVGFNAEYLVQRRTDGICAAVLLQDCTENSAGFTSEQASSVMEQYLLALQNPTSVAQISRAISGEVFYRSAFIAISALDSNLEQLADATKRVQKMSEALGYKVMRVGDESLENNLAWLQELKDSAKLS